MSDNDFDFQLNLPNPWDIPLDDRLDSEQKQKLAKSLKLLLKAVRSPSLDKSLIILKEAIDCLGTIATESIPIKNTKTALKNWEVQDYDRYFQIERVTTTEPAACLIQGLLVNCRAFFLLCQKNRELDPRQIEIQKQGFISYAYLLARNFQLEI